MDAWKLSVLGLAAALAACNGGDNTTDTGPADTGADVAPTDTGGGDTAEDTVPMDTGTMMDAAADVTDTGPADTGSDASTCPADAGLTHPNGCTTFMDLSAPTAVRTIMFGGALGEVYSPNCIQIAAGQQVTWVGTFNFHPLEPGIAPSRAPMCDSPGTDPSPIMPDNSATSGTVTYTFPNPGVYPFYCMFHESFGMYGAVLVQ